MTSADNFLEKFRLDHVFYDAQRAPDISVLLTEGAFVRVVARALVDSLLVRVDLLAQSAPLSVLVAVDLAHALSQVSQLLMAFVHVDRVLGSLATALPFSYDFATLFFSVPVDSLQHRLH